jgi:integrase/recombinase XerC
MTEKIPDQNPLDHLIQNIQKPEALVPLDYQSLLDSFYSNKKKTTLKTYRDCLEVFRQWLNVPTELDAVKKLLVNGLGHANQLALQYRDYLTTTAEAAPSSVNLKLAALRSVVDMANKLGLVVWKLNVTRVEGILYKDTKGPGKDGFQKLLEQAWTQAPHRAARDVAIIWLLYGRALRREEVASLRLEDFDQRLNAVHVLRKRQNERQALTLSLEIIKSIINWLKIRGDRPGPLFCSIDKGDRLILIGNKKTDPFVPLTGHNVWRIVSKLGRKCNLHTWPHGLRHAAITEALTVTKGNLRAVQRFSGHKDIKTLMMYDDNREDLGGDVSKQLGTASDPKLPEEPKQPKQPPI